MKNSFCFFLFVFLLLSSSLLSSARLPKDDKEMDKVDDEIAHLITSDFSSFMGLEGCEEKDEECVKRRGAAEAHLDYIYTQSRNKP